MMEAPPTKVVLPAEIEASATVSVDAAIEVHRCLGPGLLEGAYEECLSAELELRRIPHDRQVPIPLTYKGRSMPVAFRADLPVQRRLLIELKTVDEVLPIHVAQTITYLKRLGLPLALLMNFNAPLMKSGLRRVLNLPRT